LPGTQSLCWEVWRIRIDVCSSFSLLAISQEDICCAALLLTNYFNSSDGKDPIGSNKLQSKETDVALKVAALMAFEP
jgi:hypothetical protein